MTDVIIQYPEAFEEKKKRIIKAGVNQLHVLSDFDRTITYGTTAEGKRTETVISQLRSDVKYLGEDYFKKSHELFDFYHPIEVDASIPIEEKKTKMHEWWMKHFSLLIERGLNKEVIEQVVKERPLRFRDGALDFIKTLDENEIPLIFMSAAPGDMLIEYLKKNNLLTENVHVISNRYEFDENGKAIKILEPIIHVLNKAETSLKDFPLYEQLENRKNVILLGDGLGDADMAEGSDYNDIIKIGFLNEKVEENLQSFKDKFDVVILGDPDMSYVNDLLQEIK
jgi:5'-nucleotidase